MAERILTGTDITLANGSNTNTKIGAKETFLDRNAKLIPSDETATAITNMNWIAGHHTVIDLEHLYKIPDFILSQSCYADKVSENGKDAIGQLWYVETDNNGKGTKGYYMLVNWNNRGNAAGWSKTNIKSLINEDGNSSTQYLNVNNNPNNKIDPDKPEEKYDKHDNIHSITIDGSGNHSYIGWTQDYDFAPSADGVQFSYSHCGGRKDSSINIPVLNDGNTINQGPANANKAGVVTADQYNKIISRLTYLEKWCIWQSGLANNKSTYVWSGTLGEFNRLDKADKNFAKTTFIITN